ncbi:hypothetical protein WKV44_10150, partial [Spirochaetia bacterium 38H-sp]
SDETKGEYQVVSLVGTSDVAEGTKIWTKDVILKSHPAKKEELQVGMVVLYTGGDIVKNDEELKSSTWRRGVLLSTDELYKDVVALKGLWQETYKINVRHLRIIDDPIIEAPKEK